MISSSSSAALLRMFSGDTEDEAPRALPRATGPTLVKLSDPLENAELAVELLDEVTAGGRRRNARLARKRERGLVRDDQGEVTYNGRKCCAELVRRLNRALHVIAVPSEHVCDCGTVYAVQQSTREERRHVW